MVRVRLGQVLVRTLLSTGLFRETDERSAKGLIGVPRRARRRVETRRRRGSRVRRRDRVAVLVFPNQVPLHRMCSKYLGEVVVRRYRRRRDGACVGLSKRDGDLTSVVHQGSRSCLVAQTHHEVVVKYVVWGSSRVIDVE